MRQKMVTIRKKRKDGTNKENSSPPNKKVCAGNSAIVSAVACGVGPPKHQGRPPPLPRTPRSGEASLRSAVDHNTAVGSRELREIPMNQLNQGRSDRHATHLYFPVLPVYTCITCKYLYYL